MTAPVIVPWLGKNSEVRAERLRIYKMLLAEFVPASLIDRIRDAETIEGAARGAISTPNVIPPELKCRALRITAWKICGPEWPAICDAHWVPNAYAEWDKCGRVRVVDALRGRHCIPNTPPVAD